jgi:cytoskeletal protein RodZ
MQTQQHPQDDLSDRPSASRDAGRGDRRAPQLREVQDEERLALGEEFRTARLQRGDDLAAVAAKLRIRADHLQAIEDGRFDDLPGKTYASGFLRSYARHLGLDPNAVLARYRQESRSDPSANALYFPEPIKEARRPRAWLVALALILLGGVYAAWYYGSAERRVAQEVWPLPDHTAGTVESGLDTMPASTQPASTTTEPTAQPESGFAAATPQAPPAPQTGYPTTAAPIDDGQQPAMLRGEGTQEATAHGDTAAAAMGPRDWRAEPATAPETGAMAQSGNEASATAPQAPAPQAQAQAQDEQRSRTPEFGNLIAATRGAHDAEGQDRVAALPPDNASVPRPGEAPAATAPSEGSAGGTQQTMASLHPVTLHARDATWIQLSGQDGSVLVSRIFQPGESYQVPDETGLMLTTGNAGGLDIEVDGSHTGPIGPVGAVRRHISIDRLRADAR